MSNKAHDINRWIFMIPLSDVQDLNVSSVTDECICCGKKIKSPKYSVHLLTNGDLVSTDQPFSDKEDQGFFNIGSDCIKRLPNNFYFKI